VDEFLIDLGPGAAQQLGQLRKVDIGFANRQGASATLAAASSSWCLQAVEVLHLASGQRTCFVYGDWLSDRRRRVQLLPGASNGGGGGSYRLSVRTSDIKGAGQRWNLPAAADPEACQLATQAPLQPLPGCTLLCMTRAVG
jgi:hypothetical protein